MTLPIGNEDDILGIFQRSAVFHNHVDSHNKRGDGLILVYNREVKPSPFFSLEATHNFLMERN
jgi:hypothetical protein